jgi:hypothetical protein
VDYVGVGDGFARAMDPAYPEHARKDIETDSLLVQFEIEIANVLDRFAGIDRTASGFEVLQAAHDRLPDDKAMARFAAQYGMLQGICEAAYPDLRLEAHRADYKWLSKVYASVTPADDTRDLLWNRLGAKTLELVHGHIGEVTVSDTGVDVLIADEGTIQRPIEAGVIDPDAGTGLLLVLASSAMFLSACGPRDRRTGINIPGHRLPGPQLIPHLPRTGKRAWGHASTLIRRNVGTRQDRHELIRSLREPGIMPCILLLLLHLVRFGSECGAVHRFSSCPAVGHYGTRSALP